MNCYKFATVKSGSIDSGFAFKLTQEFGDLQTFTSSISKSSPLNLDLTYKDLCRLSQGVDIGKPWAIRGPYCDNYHRYRGLMTFEDWVGAPGDLGTYSTLYFGVWTTFNISIFISYNLWGICPHDKFDGRLNAYGRKAKKAAGDAPPPDPENPEPCPTQAGINFIGVPLGVTDPNSIPPSELINIEYGMSPGLGYNYNKINNAPYTGTGTLVLYFTSGDGEPSGYPYEIEITGKRNIQIDDTWGG